MSGGGGVVGFVVVLLLVLVVVGGCGFSFSNLHSVKHFVLVVIQFCLTLTDLVSQHRPTSKKACIEKQTETEVKLFVQRSPDSL